MAETVRVKGAVENEFKSDASPFSLYFDPEANNIRLDKQKIDYDLSKETELRVGPYVFDENSVSMQMSRETGEFYEVDFGFDVQRRIGPIYVLSFRWPVDFIQTGVIEIIDDKGESLWRRHIKEQDAADWRAILESQTNKELFERRRDEIQKGLIQDVQKKTPEQVRKELQLAQPTGLSKLHQRSQFGLAHKGFFEIPITQITGAFRYCVSEDKPTSRLALCSRRYQFVRDAGRYRLKVASQNERPRVLVNDKPVTLKGSAIFLQYDIPIKFSAILKAGTYFEFVSNPKEVRLVDVVLDDEKKKIFVIGYGDSPMGQIEESFYADSVHWGFLNFMPTIGDLRKFWITTLSPEAPYLYLRGEGGAPFRQSLDFEALPRRQARLVLDETNTKSTYSDKVWLTGNKNPNVEVFATDTEVTTPSPEKFRWNYPAPKKGEYNKSFIQVRDGEHTWKAFYEIYRSYPLELSARLTGVISSDAQVLLLGEVATQYWIEDIFGIESFRLTKQRWGLAARHFQTMAAFGGDEDTNTDISLAVTNVDLKYRFSPGVWGRDPTVGAILSAQNVTYSLGTTASSQEFTAPMVGGGVFWARSMPKVFDDFFNLIPIFRYPKWVDWEFLWYPMNVEKDQTMVLNTVMNFHGKIQWTPRFFGEGGFGIKTFSWEDVSQGKSVALGIAYGTVGIGYNF